METPFVEADRGPDRDTGGGRRAFSAAINGVFINVYEPVNDFIAPGLPGGLPAVQRPRRPSRIAAPPRSLHGQFLHCTFYPLQTSRNHEINSFWPETSVFENGVWS